MPARRRDVLWSRVAEDDLLDIVSFIAADRPQVALDVLQEVRRRAGSLATVSERGREVPELQKLGLRSYREVVVAPWRIIYRVRPAQIEIVGVVDSRRNVEDLLLARLTRTP